MVTGNFDMNLNFPMLSNAEQSWEQNLRAIMELIAPGVGVRSGLEMGLPLDGGLVAAGLVPTFRDGYLLIGDRRYGPFGSKLFLPASPGWVNRGVYYGLEGVYYADANNEPHNDAAIRLGSLSTDSEADPSIIHIGQPYNYGAGRLGVRGVVNLAACAKATDTVFFNWPMVDTGLPDVRIIYAEARMIHPVNEATGAGDDFVLKLSETGGANFTALTVGNADMGTENAAARFNPASADGVSFRNPSALEFSYNQTDAGAAIASGAVEVKVLMELF